MKYFVDFTVKGYYTAEVEADNLDEAKEKAASAFSEADFGELFDAESKMRFIEDENGLAEYCE